MPNVVGLLLNKRMPMSLQRENYPLPTIEDVATRLHGAKVFSLLDVRSGFWHVKLDEPSSYLTTFNTPFGRYRWKRLPFGICSAPEIFQRKIALNSVNERIITAGLQSAFMGKQ